MCKVDKKINAERPGSEIVDSTGSVDNVAEDSDFRAVCKLSDDISDRGCVEKKTVWKL